MNAVPHTCHFAQHQQPLYGSQHRRVWFHPPQPSVKSTKFAGAKRTDQPEQIACAERLPALVVSNFDARQRWPGRPWGRLSQTLPAVAARSRVGCLRHSWQGIKGLACSAARRLTEARRVVNLLHADPGIGLPGQEAAGAFRQRDSHQSSSIAHAPPASAFWPSSTTGAARATAADGLEHGTSRSRP